MMEDIKTLVARQCEVVVRLTERPQVEDLCGVEREGGAGGPGGGQGAGHGQQHFFVLRKYLAFESILTEL